LGLGHPPAATRGFILDSRAEPENDKKRAFDIDTTGSQPRGKND
jgi:hypothetical protein